MENNIYWYHYEKHKSKAINTYIDWMIIWYDDYLKTDHKKLNVHKVYSGFLTTIIYKKNYLLNKDAIENLDFREFDNWKMEIKSGFIKKWKEKRVNEKEAKN